MDPKRIVKVSKYLSKHLRHHPERLGLVLEPGGWVEIDDLLRACADRSFAVTRAELDEVVARNDKQRFSYHESGTKIRANQGHSIEVDLGLEPAIPPDVLFHGTGAGSVDPILRYGLSRRGRNHVHLSPDPETAIRVGARHGRPAVLEVAAGRMAADGYEFFVSDNGVWLTLEVPVTYLTRQREPRRRHS
jgi:putative RNA 2'-phosphotransferase